MRLTPRTADDPPVKYAWHRGPLRVRYDARHPDASMSRFGGGWHWVLGVQAGRFRKRANGKRHGTVIVNLGVSSVRFTWRATR